MKSDLKPWFAIARPHKDIRENRMDEAVFAANLWAVFQGEAPEVYLDPEVFFEKTFLTTGLRNVLLKVGSALSGKGDTGDRILSLQTRFGGGKTHTLVSLWHLAKHAEVIDKAQSCADLREVLGAALPKSKVNVAVFTNKTCDVTQGRKTPEGIHTHTLWGELAVQLGGKKLYEKVREHDEKQRVPQGIFEDILKEASPCLILMDELADYCVGAAGVEVGDTSLADQTISFIQQLTEAVGQVRDVALVATLPASHLEVGGTEKGQEILQRLEKRFGRMGADIEPVAGEEIYEIVRRRLFESIGESKADRNEQLKVALAYYETYKQHEAEVPKDASKTTYRDQIVQAYPFHPTLIDALYERWGSHPDFQRTRGVLRMLASIVGDLWQRRDTCTQSQPLIQPCHVRWNVGPLSAVITRLYGAGFEAVIASDVLGQRANATALDEDRGGDWTRESIAQGLAAAIMLGSFGGKAERSGFSTKDLKLCCSRPGLNWNYTDSALMGLEERGFYLHTAGAGSLGKRFWFGVKPTLNKLIVQYRQEFSAETFDGEIVDALKAESKNTGPDQTWRVLVAPDRDLAEQKTLALLVLSPDVVWTGENGSDKSWEQAIKQLSEHCGKGNRTYRNTLLFLMCSQRGLSRLRQAFREKAALEAVATNYGSQLDDEQKGDLKSRLGKAEDSVLECLGPAYSVVARMEGQELTAIPLPDAGASFAEHLGIVWKTVVEEEEWVLRKLGPVTLKETGLIPDEGAIRVKDAAEAFLRYTDKQMIASKDAVVLGLQQACGDGEVGIARGSNATNPHKKWCGEHVQIDPNEDGLWIIPAFTPEEEPVPAGKGATNGGDKGDGGTATTTATEDETDTTTKAKVIRRIVISGNVPAENWSDLFSCFVNPSVRSEKLKPPKFGIKFEIESNPDQPLDENDSTFKSMKEAAQQLGLEFEVEE